MSSRPPPPIPALDGPSFLRQFRADVLAGLASAPKEIPCKYFYDAAGSALFDRICDLDEYYLTRTELALMEAHAADMADCCGAGCELVEYGSGSGVKTRLLLDHLAAPAAYVPVDISYEPLQQAAADLARRYPGLVVRPLHADFTRPLTALPNGAGRRVVYFPGSTLGNFPPAEAVALLRQTARRCGPGGGLLLGADLKKDPAVLHAAYNDRPGVTAAFNRNLLHRINRELGADFAVDAFWHHAVYDPLEGRIVMYLVSRQPQAVRVGGAIFAFDEGEAIRTEYSYKYSPADLRRLAAAGGFAVRRAWTDPRGYFSVLYLVATDTPV